MEQTDYEEEPDAQQVDWRTWLRVIKVSLVHRRTLVPMAIASILIGASDSLFHLVTQHAIDALRIPGTPPEAVLPYTAAYMGLAALLVVNVFALIFFAGRLSTDFGYASRRDVFAQLQKLPFTYYDRRSVGWLMSRVNTDCSRLSEFITWGTVDIVWSATMISMTTLILLWMNWRLALVVLLVMPPLAVGSLYIKNRVLEASRRIRKMNALITGAFNEGINGVRTTKTLVREDASAAEFATQADEMYNASMRSAWYMALYQPLVSLLAGAGIALALWYGGIQTLGGALTLGQLVAFFAYTVQLFGPIQECAHIFTQMPRAQASAERLFALLDTDPVIKDSPEVRAAMERHRVSAKSGDPFLAEDGLPRAIQCIEFRNVTFKYQDGPTVLRDFNLTVRAGETIALVGPTGGGKSTIVSLLCRFYEPTAGEILIDGVDYRRRSLAFLQGNLGMVLQSPHLFGGSVRENIRYGRLDATDAEVVAAAQRVNAHGFITQLEKGYDSDVGEGGNKLSTGQKQLVALARATLANPQLFVLDEATSSVDTQTEHLIQSALETVLSGRISVVIAHRLSTIRRADRILVIEDGKITESGSHHDLLKHAGHYHHLYTSQFVREEMLSIETEFKAAEVI
jgi:ATP-binding cassette, subfamily B, bacterial